MPEDEGDDDAEAAEATATLVDFGGGALPLDSTLRDEMGAS